MIAVCAASLATILGRGVDGPTAARESARAISVFQRCL